MADANSFFDWVGTTLSGFRFIPRDTARADDVNTALDYVSTGFTAVEVKTDAAIRLPDGETAATLGNAVARAGKVLGFNATTGAVEATITADEISNAQTYATNAASSASDAAQSVLDAAAIYDAFDDRYLGSQPADPATDNDGNALVEGALYWNSTAGEMRAYDGAAWWAAYLPAGDYVVGPSSAVDSKIALFSGATGKLIKDSGVALSDKQDALVSGTNIKTVRGRSILGSGEIAGPSWTTITADPADAVVGTSYMCDTSAGAFTVTLPATPTAGDLIYIGDYAGTFDAENLTIGRNGSKIMGLAEDLTISTPNVSLTLQYIDATQGWKIL